MGPFEIEARLDAAGAPRYLAHKRDAPARKLVLSVHDLDNADSARLSVDLQRARRVGHPGVALADLTVDAGQRILSIERLDGLCVGSLLTYLDTVSERLADAAVCRIGCELMKAVAAAHQWRDDAGVVRPLVHGMLGPRQVHVSWTGEVKVLGFGLVALYRLAPDPPWDEGGAYLAPEVRAGRMATARADVYSAARLTWGLLTQRRVPEGLEPEPLTQARPDLDKRAAKAIDRALDVSSANRTITCDEIAEALEPLADSMELEWNMELLRAVLPPGQEEACAEAVVTLIPFEPDSSDKQPTAVHELPRNVLGGRDDFSSEPPDSEEEPTAVMTLPKRIERPAAPAPKAEEEAVKKNDRELPPRAAAGNTLQGPAWQNLGKQLAAAAAAEAESAATSVKTSADKTRQQAGARVLRRAELQVPPPRARQQTELGLGAKRVRAETERALRMAAAAEQDVGVRDHAADKRDDERAARITKAKEQRAVALDQSRPVKLAPKPAETPKPARAIERKRHDKPALDPRRAAKSLQRSTLRSARSEILPDEALVPPPKIELIEERAPAPILDAPPVAVTAVESPPEVETPIESEPPPIEAPALFDEPTDIMDPAAEEPPPNVEIPPVIEPPATAAEPVPPAPAFVTPSLRAIDVLTASGDPPPDPKRRKSTLEATSTDTKAPPARGRWAPFAVLLAVALIGGAAVAFGSRWLEETGAADQPSTRTDVPPVTSAPQPEPDPIAPPPSIAPSPVAPSASATASATASASAAPIADPASLPPNQGQVVMEPPLPGIEVWVSGVRAGMGDETVVARCGNVPVVLMTPDKSWRSKARAVPILCRRLNRVSIEPTAAPVRAVPRPRVAPVPRKGSQWLRR